MGLDTIQLVIKTHWKYGQKINNGTKLLDNHFDNIVKLDLWRRWGLLETERKIKGFRQDLEKDDEHLHQNNISTFKEKVKF